MDIHFISSLTTDDENQIAPRVLQLMANLLDQFPIAYSVRVETTGSKVLQHTNMNDGAVDSFMLEDLAAPRVVS